MRPALRVIEHTYIVKTRIKHKEYKLNREIRAQRPNHSPHIDMHVYINRQSLPSFLRVSKLEPKAGKENLHGQNTTVLLQKENIWTISHSILAALDSHECT